MRLYKQQNVLEAATERVAWIFDTFQNIVVSISGGKDSTVLFHIVHKEAVTRDKKFTLFFLDQEAEYKSTIEQVRHMMSYSHVIPGWYQVPAYMTNAASYEDELLYAWGEGEDWMRAKEMTSIHKINEDYPERFYPFFRWIEKKYDSDTAVLVGMRSEESLNRYRALIKNPAFPDITWSTKTSGRAVRFYPIYDFTFEDIWTYIGKFGVRYNKIYDYLYIKGVRIPRFRVSNLIHEKSFNCLTMLQEFEPETYNKLIKRLKGVHVAALYANEKTMFKTVRLPKAYKTWKQYRDFLLDNTPLGRRQVFIDRFTRQDDDEDIYRKQTKQLLLNDWENNIPVVKRKKEDPLEKWREIL